MPAVEGHRWEVGNRLLGSGLTFDHQLVGGVLPDQSQRGRTTTLVAPTSSEALRDLPRLRDSSELFLPIAFGAVAVIYHLPWLLAPLRRLCGRRACSGRPARSGSGAGTTAAELRASARRTVRRMQCGSQGI